MHCWNHGRNLPRAMLKMQVDVLPDMPKPRHESGECERDYWWGNVPIKIVAHGAQT